MHKDFLIIVNIIFRIITKKRKIFLEKGGGELPKFTLRRKFEEGMIIFIRFGHI